LDNRLSGHHIADVKREITTLFLGNLPASFRMEDVRDLAAPHGPVLSVRLAIDRDTGHSRKFAFIEVDADAADRMIAELGSRPVNGRTLSVSVARTPPHAPA
jgi:RNA recognition motif-containing protein